MKIKILSLLIVLALLSIYPIWRYNNNAKFFAEAVLAHASMMGKWTHQSISNNLDGKITINNLTFKPNNHSQSFDISSMVITTSPMFILKSNAYELDYMLPESMSIAINSAILTRNSNDINQALKSNSMWMLIAGYAGSFGCIRESSISFDDTSWANILDKDQIFNVDLYYSRQFNGSLDVDLILDAENLFSSTWSSNLKSSYPDNQIIIDELLVDKLFYAYLDNGFNFKRNNACMKNYQSSFAKYRLSSAEHIQKYLREHFSKELPKTLINWYQRMLAPDVEYNAIITLNDRKYLNDVYRINQRDLYENSMVEISTAENEYLPITLTDIDYTSIDTEILKQENLRKKKKARLAKLEAEKKKNAKFKPTVFRTGTKVSRQISLADLSVALNKKVRIKTSRGRPITGYIVSIDNHLLVLDSTFKTGTSTITIPINKLSSVEILK